MTCYFLNLSKFYKMENHISNYKLKCFVFHLSSWVTVTIQILVPDMAPQDLRCSAVSPQSVRVRWDPPPPEHRNGVIEGYKVLYRHVNLLGGEKQTAYLN